MPHSWRAGASYDVTTGSSSAASATTFPFGVRAVLLTATAACRVRFGNGTPTALTTDTLVPPNFPMFFLVTSGQKVAAIQEAAAGKLNITELTT